MRISWFIYIYILKVKVQQILWWPPKQFNLKHQHRGLQRPSLDSFTTLRYWGSDFLEYLSVGIQVPSAETGVQGLGLKFGRLIPGVDFSVEDGNHMSTWNVSEIFWFLSEYKQKMHQSSTLPHVRSVNSTMIISMSFGSARLLFHTSERKDQILSN